MMPVATLWSHNTVTQYTHQSATACGSGRLTFVIESGPTSAINRPLPQAVLTQSLNFHFCQPAPFAYWQSFVIEYPDPRPSQLNNRMTNCIEHPTNLLIAPLMKSHFKPRVRLNLA